MPDPTKAELKAELTAIRGEVAELSQELDEVSAKVDALPDEPGPDPDPNPEPDDPLIFAIDDDSLVGATMHFPKGAWLGMRTLLLIARFDNDAAKYEKLAGCASSQDSRGGMGLGRQPDGDLEGWVGGPFPQPQIPATARKASVIMWRLGDGVLEVRFDDTSKFAPFDGPVAKFDGAAVLGAGYWRGNVVDPIQGAILAAAGYRDELSDEAVDAWRTVHAGLIDPEPLPPPEPPQGGSGLEPVNQSALQVAITVGNEPRQTWHGYGYGLNDWTSAVNVFPRVRDNVDKLTTDINASIMRIFTPENPSGCLNAYKPYWDLLKGRGVDTIFASCFLYRSNSSPDAIASGVKACIDGGMDASRWILSVQNEPDGNPLNAVKGDFVSHHRSLRDALNARGLQRVEIAGLEWRHPSTHGPDEYDAYASVGMVGADKVISAGCLHIYDKGPDAALYDQRYLKAGCGIWSTELGNNGSPSAQARMLAGLNHGTVCEFVHYCMIATASPNSEQLQQSLLDWNGKPRPWYGGLQIISQALTRGTVMRLCRSSDRPAGLPAAHAERMVRNAAQTGGRNPRQQVAVGRRPDGKWAILAVNTTHGSDGFNAFTSGHYGEALQQITVTIPDLDGRDGVFDRRSATIDGGVINLGAVPMVDGRIRFTVAPAETTAMVGRS